MLTARWKRGNGFTIIELMVALVVGGVLMAALVSLSTAVQKSFGRSRDISDLQSNLRFAIKVLSEDFARASYMTVPSSSRIQCKNFATGGYNKDAVAQLPATGTIILRGNFVSSRDYRFLIIDSRSTLNIVCRDGGFLLANCNNPDCDSDGAMNAEDLYNRPFTNSPTMERTFVANELVRISQGTNVMYRQIQSVAGCAINLTQDIVMDGPNSVKGCSFDKPCWVNPVTEVRYQVVEGTYRNSPYSGSEVEKKRWILQRTHCLDANCQSSQVSEIAEFLLPPFDATAPGLALELYFDTNPTATNGMGLPWDPVISATPTPLPPSGSNAALLDAMTIRAVGITLRGRMELEDPDFTINNYSTDAAAKNFGVDVDASQIGLARVRVERTVVELRNMSLNYCL